MSPSALRALLALGCLFLVPPRLRAEIPLRDRIQRENQKLGEVKNRYDTVQRKIRSLTTRRDELDQRLSQARREQTDLEQQIARLETENRQATQDVEKARKELVRVRQAHASYQENYAQRLVHFYKRARLSPIGPLLESRSLGDMAHRHRYLQFLQEDSSKLHKLESGRLEVATRTQALEQARLHAEQLRDKLELRKRTLESNILEQSGLLDRIRRERSHEITRAERLGEAQEILRKKIKNLQSAARIASRQSAAAARRTRKKSARKGQMRWPVDGARTILKPYGRMTNEAGTPEFNSGIDILVTRPTSVRASAAGRVMFQGIFSPVYGKVVMIDHGGSPGNVISLYGNLETILVGVDQQLEEGDIVGMVGGEANSGRASHLHLEIRKGPDAQNPIHWLAPK